MQGLLATHLKLQLAHSIRHYALTLLRVGKTSRNRNVCRAIALRQYLGHSPQVSGWELLHLLGRQCYDNSSAARGAVNFNCAATGRNAALDDDEP